jgi:hypothetical protein
VQCRHPELKLAAFALLMDVNSAVSTKSHGYPVLICRACRIQRFNFITDRNELMDLAPQRLIPPIIYGGSRPFRGVGANSRTKVLGNLQPKRLGVLACSVYRVTSCSEPCLLKALVLRFRPSCPPTHSQLNRRR